MEAPLEPCTCAPGYTCGPCHADTVAEKRDAFTILVDGVRDALARLDGGRVHQRVSAIERETVRDLPPDAFLEQQYELQNGDGVETPDAE